MSAEKDRVLGHAEECDGIEEYDNALPGWWLGLFIACVIFSIIYVPYTHFVAHWSQAGQYDAEMAEAKTQYKQADPATMVVAETPELLAKGKELFEGNCVACHGADLHGGIGPNLTDATWIHGGTLKDIQTTITNGVPEKAMPTWGPILGPEKIAALAAYVHSAGGGQ